MDQTNQYTFSAKAKRFTMILMGIGALALIYGIITMFTGGHEAAAEGHEVAAGHAGHHVPGPAQRFWSNILINGFFFFSISLAASFFLAVQYAAQAGWSSLYKRVIEALTKFMLPGGAVLILVFAAGDFLHAHHIYSWMDPTVMDPDHENYDSLTAHKAPYLNSIFFWVRTLAYLTVWYLFTRWFLNKSKEEDQLTAEEFSSKKRRHVKNVAMAAGFLVFFGYTSTTASWDWIMSIDVHWFSTIFGWYIFAGMWIAGIISMLLLTIYLKSLGHLPEINSNHLHDMGKWMFGVSFLWSYLFFCQFMLIWYSNIPEEVTYYMARFEDYTFTFWLTFIINFTLPMLFLMSKDAKRNAKYLFPVGVIIFIGHWLDVYMLITPGAMQSHGTIGFLEIGMALGFLGLFLFVVLNALSKAPLLAKNHPYLEESLHHHVQ